MRFNLLALTALCLAALAWDSAPLVAEDPPPVTTPSEWKPEQTSVSIPLRDGAALAADVWLPATPGKYPVVVVQTPYDRAHFRPSMRAAATAKPALTEDASGGFGDTSGGLARFVDREHYVYVTVDWRGFFGSRAAARAVPSLGRDGFDVVEWAASQTWSDGKVGTWGPSALGVVQYQTAAERPPHLVCAVPVVAAYGYHYDDYFERGVLREAHTADLDRLGFGTGARVREARTPDAPLYRLARALERPAQIDVPLFFVTGWLDHGIARTLETAQALFAFGGPRCRAGSKMLIGPWHHMAVDLAQQGDVAFPAQAGEASKEVRAFLDRHLRGVGAQAWDARPRVRFARMGEDGWASADSIPWPVAAPRAFTLHANGTLDVLPAGADELARSIYDDPEHPVPTIGGANLPLSGLATGPRDQTPLCVRPDVLVYTTPPLEAPLRIDGACSLSIWILTDALDADVAVRLCQVIEGNPEAPTAPATAERTMLVADGIARASFNGRSFAPLTPSVPQCVTVSLPPTAITLGKGVRLRLLVAGSNWPRFERNGHTGRAGFDATTAVAAKVEFLHDAAHPAVLTVPVAK